MKDTLFIQFYSKIKNINPRFPELSHYEVCNGFSDTLDLCKSKGDMLWVKHNKQSQIVGKDINENIDTNLPIDKGTIFVSASYITHLYQVYKWAFEYPNIKFIVGGSAASTQVYNIDETLIPNNLIITDHTVEEHFGVPNFSYPWKLELPPDEDQSMTLNYIYTLMNKCYWGKCIFCNFSNQPRRIRKNINLEFLDLEYEGLQRINLYSPSTTPEQLEILLGDTVYNEKMRYDMYLRPNQTERELLKKLLIKKGDDFPWCKLFLGIEFPSNRMLNIIKKNNTVEDYISTIEMLTKYGTKENIIIHLPFILCWNCLTPSDVESLRYFLSKMDYDKAKFVYSVNSLVSMINTPIYDTYTKGEPLTVGPFYYGFKPKISEEQLDLSRQCYDILKEEEGVTILDSSIFNKKEIQNE